MLQHASAAYVPLQFLAEELAVVQPAHADDITQLCMWYSARKELLEAGKLVDSSHEGLHQVILAYCSSCCALSVHRTCYCMPSSTALGK